MDDAWQSQEQESYQPLSAQEGDAGRGIPEDIQAFDTNLSIIDQSFSCQNLEECRFPGCMI